MIVARDDMVCPADLQLAAYARAREPKQLLTVAGGHFDVYEDHPAFEQSAAAATSFFQERLR
ncbi:alpha/beta hydrolase [Streptomyces sp. TRM70350]|uniref:alpha/beta hydrolase n=1 Tax=Streptomyces sp. TRM70350 TaxID=2856165 RepID=UPI00210FEDD6|nr:alpha/beta hydrolase [Streptomyces sp. TRM70350]